MQQLTAIIQKFFPEETIVKQSRIKLTDTWKTGLSIGKYFYLKPIPMVETDKKIYFDKRIPLIFQAIVSTLISPVWFTLFLAVIQLIFKVNYPVVFYAAIIVLSLLVGLLNLTINIFTLQNIFVIDKSWIAKRRKEKGVEIIEGQIQNGGESYYLVAFLSQDQKSTLSLLDRFSGKMLFAADFKLKIVYL